MLGAGLLSQRLDRTQDLSLGVRQGDTQNHAHLQAEHAQGMLQVSLVLDSELDEENLKPGPNPCEQRIAARFGIKAQNRPADKWLQDTVRWQLAASDANLKFPHAANVFACAIQARMV